MRLSKSSRDHKVEKDDNASDVEILMELKDSVHIVQGIKKELESHISLSVDAKNLESENERLKH